MTYAHKITRLEIKNVTAFTKLEVDFSPGINVIIGENGTGKTHLLKAAYGLCTGGLVLKRNPDISNAELASALTTKFQRLLMPLDDKLGKIHRHGAGTEQAVLYAQFENDYDLKARFSNKSKSLAILDSSKYIGFQSEPVFIPTKEVLSFMKGFNSLYEKYGLSFDQTYQDICFMLDLPEIRPETLHIKSKWAMDEIAKICGGSFVFYGGGKVTFKTTDAEYSANATAEGFRKIGMLSRLLETGAIQPGISGPLFWDEPESNINPKLMKIIVQILLELSRNGQQIVIATHEYILLKWFDILIDKKGKDDQIRFHRLYRDSQSGATLLESVDDFRAIGQNAIADTYDELTKEQVKKKMEGLGQ